MIGMSEVPLEHLLPVNKCQFAIQRCNLQAANHTLGPSNFARMVTTTLFKGSRLASTHSSVSGRTSPFCRMRAATLLAISSRETVVGDVGESCKAIAVSRARHRTSDDVCGFCWDVMTGGRIGGECVCEDSFQDGENICARRIYRSLPTNLIGSRSDSDLVLLRPGTAGWVKGHCLSNTVASA